ncbi:alanine--tRNA ligase [Lacihabitans sp. LS3-19]|uniref:alanine--tRNA ligase n=1 Tax=Lacihabitans sp. LS3-19 TaxID=2487335 RepID=UPI0020CE09A1|nr:alanine--tRNA ligase [Lacihabitans sp. LS3-19]MCP9767027.1 alanine--tRNA ligase [Lacihabitans sp. LS3-19]
MTSHQIRKAFLDFFVSKGHLIVPSAPLVAKNDPTLMFNNSGMAQFKDFFLGNGTPPKSRIADTQKCLRVSGKHNDLEEVGFDTYHHTMFEMLGNWSFGDYFKKEALAWSWELLTEIYKLPKDRIYVSVFEGDEKDGVPFDQEAFDIWKEILGDDSRIILGNKKDNFWEMGDIGPCGPCSEIHIDLRDQAEIDLKGGKELVNADHPQVVEIWNNVFMQFERKADGSLLTLPAKHVDTGMGFERLCMAIQGKQSNYDTDIFQNTISVIEEMSGKKYGVNGTLRSDNYVDVAMRVISDHLRAVSFAIADGQLPSNAKAGYVIRRILRRAVRYGYSYLDFREPFMCKLVPVLATQFEYVFPELQAQVDFVTKVVEEEEKTFLRTLELGLKRLEIIFADQKSISTKVLDGNTVFELSDTFGFPVDLTALIAREKGFSIDEEGFKSALAEQKARSRKDATKEAADWIELGDVDGVEFLGYDFEESPAQLMKYRSVKTKAGDELHIVLDQTPFYAEMGGQVGDTGTITFEIEGNNYTLDVIDTKKENDLFVHITKNAKLVDVLEKSNSPINVFAKINSVRRKDIEKNHSATHLMLSAMRSVLGSHVVQRGSYQNDEVTRFDFSHFSKVTDEELLKIEDIVNEKIRENIALDEKRNVPIDDAVNMGATATFGEKYGDFVRVITFDPNFSLELCGGTHVPATGEIGLFKFTSEGSVSAGVRRVEAVTGKKALEMMRSQGETLDQIRGLLKSAVDLPKAIEALIEEKNQLQRKIESLENEKIQVIKNELLTKVKQKDGVNYLAEKVELGSVDNLRQLAYDLKKQMESPIIILGAVINGKPNLAILIDETLVQSKSLNAGNIVREAAKAMKGGGGGQPHFATAGGSDAGGLLEAIKKALEIAL